MADPNDEDTFPGYPRGFIPFKNRNGIWDDLEPLTQYAEGLAPICAIVYKKDYEEVLGYFRAILQK